MTPDIINNRTFRLADCVRDLLADGATGARFAVGYLFLDGLAPLRAEWERLDDVHLLIGNVVSRLTDEQVREEAEARLRGGETGTRDQEDMAHALREAHARASAIMALNLRRTLETMTRSPENHALLLTLARRIAQGGLKVRLYTPGRIHAKAALIAYPEQQIAVIGSSNLTLAEPGDPTEMNLVVRDPQSVVALSAWYDELWEASQDFHRELFEELGQCWAMQTEPSARMMG